jgi:prevent-host-death family protein
MSDLWRVSATEVKNSWGRVVRRVLKRRVPALVENKGVPTVVILPADDYEQLVAEREVETRRRQQIALLEEVERTAKEIAARYLDRPLPDSVDILRQIREERDDELVGLH